jgi:UDP-N-acetylglucosamine--N-acetylmuramyl-(pentapeptide) pyrophosphoryl-undecaprenol N-acetylglucosamine transferase
MVAVTPQQGSIVFAGGGSGGHLSPGLAIAERLITVAPEIGSVFLCSDRKVDAMMLREAGANFVSMPARPPSLRPVALLRFVRAWFAAGAAAERALREHGARHVVSLGGFVSAPVVRRARRMGIPVTLLNLDATPGRANRSVARWASHVWSAVRAKGLPGWDGSVTGFPVRRSAIAPGDAARCRVELGLDPARHTLLVTGASQGATSLNRFMPHFAEQRASLLAGWQVLHLAGSMPDAEIAALADRYARAGVQAKVIPFLHRMGLAWGAADVALTRAGANSVAEAALNRVPCLFVPYPHHRDLHQRENARELVEAGAAAIALDAIEPEANMQVMGRLLESLVTDGPARDRMAAALAAQPRVDAAERIARRLAELARGR